MDDKCNFPALLSANGSSIHIIPLNDILDLCIRSMLKKSVNNYAL